MKTYKLGRKKANRDQLVSNLTASLLMYERIVTTKPKARLTQRNVEHIISHILKLSDTDGLRYGLQVLGQKTKAAKKLVEVIKGQYKSSHGGYTRIINIGNRKGDNAEMVILELTRKMDLPDKTVPKTEKPETVTKANKKVTKKTNDADNEKNS